MVSMGLQTALAVLSLTASTTTAWPQLLGGRRSDVPYVPRSLPVVDEAISMGTIHVPNFGPKRRHLPPVDDDDDRDEMLFTLPAGGRQGGQGGQGGQSGGKGPAVSPRGTVQLPVIHAPKPGLVRRDIEVQLENRSDVAYYAQLYMGSPPQEVYAQLDTGSFELWVNPDCSSLSSSSDQTFCRAVGVYEPDESRTSERSRDSETLRYGVGSASVTYYYDNVALSDETRLEGIRFGVADGGTEDQFAGVLGLGYGDGDNTDYPNFMDEMRSQGVIRTKTFSVALGSKAEGGGVAVFGGVDTAKFAGRLARLPILPPSEAPDGVARYWVQLDSIAHAGPAGGGRRAERWAGSSMPVFLDTGATLTLLPPDLVEAMARDLGSRGTDDAGFHVIDCSLVRQPGAFDFAFDGVTIRVPYREIIRQFHHGGRESCYLGVAPSDDYSLLGDTFLRSAYVVFDQESDSIFLAQYENCGSEVSRINRSSDLDGLQGSCRGATQTEASQETDDDEEEEEEEDDSSSSASARPSSSSSAGRSSTAASAAATASAAESDDDETESTQTSTSTSVSRPTTSTASDEGSDDEDDDDESGESTEDSEEADLMDTDNGAAGAHPAWLGLSLGGMVLAAMW